MSRAATRNTTTREEWAERITGGRQTPTVLCAHEMGRLDAGIKRLAYLGGAIESVGNVIEAIKIFSESSPCPLCDDLHQQMAAGLVSGGLNTAMKELGHLVADIAYQMEDVLERADFLGPGEQQ
jgi:hypothetical protein